MRTVLFTGLALGTLFLGCSADPSPGSAGPAGAAGSSPSTGEAGRAGTAATSAGNAGAGGIAGTTGTGGAKAGGGGDTQASKGGAAGMGTAGKDGGSGKSSFAPSDATKCVDVYGSPLASLPNGGFCSSKLLWNCAGEYFDVVCDCETKKCECAKVVDGYAQTYKTVSATSATCGGKCGGSSLYAESAACFGVASVGGGEPAPAGDEGMPPPSPWLDFTDCTFADPEPILASNGWRRPLPVVSPDGTSLYLQLEPRDPASASWSGDGYSLPSGVHRFAIDLSGGGCKLTRDATFREPGRPYVQAPGAPARPAGEYAFPVARLYAAPGGAVFGSWYGDFQEDFAGGKIPATRRVFPTPALECPSSITLAGIGPTGTFFHVSAKAMAAFTPTSDGCPLVKSLPAGSDKLEAPLTNATLFNAAASADTLYLGWDEGYGWRRVLEARDVSTGKRLWSLERPFVAVDPSTGSKETQVRFEGFDSITPCGDQVCVWDSIDSKSELGGRLMRFDSSGKVTGHTTGAAVRPQGIKEILGLAFHGAAGYLLGGSKPASIGGPSSLKIYRATPK